MDLKSFENIFIKNNYTNDYYNMIFSLLSKENADIELNNRWQVVQLILGWQTCASYQRLYFNGFKTKAANREALHQ